nr:MAG TPA: SRP54-type protein, helical bundle domain [Caudoviricetes sp.]
MNVFEAMHKQDRLNAIVQTLRSGKTIDNDVLADFLQEYYDLLGSLPVGYTEVKWNEKL